MGTLKAGIAVAAVLLIAARPPVTPPPASGATTSVGVKGGVERWRANDYAAAVAIWQPFAVAGDPDAMFNMGQAYKLGRGVPQDAVVARDYYRKAAMKGHLPAQANLGIALFQVGEKTESIKWLRTAADRGEPRAQYVLGIAAFNGDGMPRSQAVGYAYLLRAQTSGLPQAATALGSIAPGLSPTDRTAGEAVAASLAAGTGVPAALAMNMAPKFIPTPGAGMPRPAPVTAPTRSTGPQAPSQVASSGTATPNSLSVPALTVPPAAPTVKGAPVVATAAPHASLPSATTPSPPQVRPASPAGVASTVVAGAAATGRPGAIVPPEMLPSSRPGATSPSRVAVTSRPSAVAPSVIATTDVPPSQPVTLNPAIGAPASAQAPLPLPATVAPAVQAASLSPPVPPPAVAAANVSAPKLAVVPAKPAAPKAVATLKPFETIIPDKPAAKKPYGWRVQLGAFSQRKLADAAWAVVKSDAGGAKPIFAAEGSVVKLQMGPYASREAAKSACAKLSDAGRACFITNG